MSGRARCLDDAELAAAVDGTASSDELAHLKSCARCTRSFELVVELIRVSGESAEAADEALSLVEKRGRECAARLEGSVVPYRWSIAASREGPSPAIACAMLDRFEALMDIASPDALSMADAAITVAGFTAALLDDGGASLRCRAWKAKAVALASFACYDDAGEALDEAVRAASDVADVAAIAYARAWLFGNPDVWRPAEALALLEDHLEAFEQVSAAKYRAALLLRVGIVMRMGDLATAERELKRLAEIMETTSEGAMVAANIAYCRLRQGDAAESLKLAREAAAVYRSEGAARTILLLQTEWTIVQALGASSDPDMGLIIARRVADDFARLHLDEHAVRAELTCIRLMLAGDPEVDVQAACERVLSLCIRWPGPRATCAAEALQYLRDMAARRAATIDDAIMVETYIDELRTANPLRFRPPMPLVAM